MYTKDAIRFSMNLAEQSVMRSIGFKKDAPLTFPTENGGCHPLWVLGHLAVVEGMTHQLLAGGENPAAEWGALFGPDTIRPATRRTTLRSKKSAPGTPSFAKKILLCSIRSATRISTNLRRSNPKASKNISRPTEGLC